jgi:hypothetical protein
MQAPHTVAQLYGLPHGILGVFNTILYENEFQNPQTISLFPEHSTFDGLRTHKRVYPKARIPKSASTEKRIYRKARIPKSTT